MRVKLKITKFTQNDDGTITLYCVNSSTGKPFTVTDTLDKISEALSVTPKDAARIGEAIEKKI